MHSPQSNEPAGPILNPPLPPASLGMDLELSEVVSGDYGGQSYSMRVQTEVTPERLVVVGISHMGVPLFTLEHTTAVSLGGWSDTHAPLPFDPAYILSDLQLVHWPASVIEEALSVRGFSLEVSPHDRSRLVVDQNGQTLVEVLYPLDGPETGTTVVQHLDAPYRLSIEASGGTPGR